MNQSGHHHPDLTLILITGVVVALLCATAVLSFVTGAPPWWQMPMSVGVY